MMLKTGGYYTLRNGTYVGPMRPLPEWGRPNPFRFFTSDPYGGVNMTFTEDGRRRLDGTEDYYDVVDEWPAKSAVSELAEPAVSDPRETFGPLPVTGRKDDTGKDRFDLIPPEALFGIAKVLTFGANKYAARNWEAGMGWGRVFGALMRHMWSWWGGAGPTTKSFLFGELDEETGLSHLWHAGCCLFFLIAYEERGSGVDDRFKKPVDVVSDL